MTILWPRMILATLTAISLVIWLNIFMLGHTQGAPITGCRKSCLSFFYKLHVHIQCAVGWFTRVKWVRLSQEKVEFYEEYLGTVDE